MLTDIFSEHNLLVIYYSPTVLHMPF